MSHGQKVATNPEIKMFLDNLHKRKIDMADEIYVINVGGYIGESTRSEIDYAVENKKPVRYLEPPAKEIKSEAAQTNNSESGEICPNRKNGKCTVDW